jgi:hypothetical protein
LVLDRDLIQVRAVRHALEDESACAALCRDLPEDAGPRVDRASFCDWLEQRLADDRRELALRLHGPGRINNFFQAVPLIRAHFLLGGADEPLQFEWQPDRPLTLRITRLDLPAEDAIVLDGPRLQQAITEIEEGPSGGPTKRDRFILLSAVFVLAFFPALWTVWAFLFRGGLSLRLAGLALVRSDGRDARRLQCLWRAMIVWLPVVALLLAAVWVDLWFPARGFVCSWLQVLTLLLLLGYVAVALRFPGRGPHDYLAGTFLVPR